MTGWLRLWAVMGWICFGDDDDDDDDARGHDMVKSVLVVGWG